LPTLFKDAHAYAHKCLICQRSVGHDRNSTATLQPIFGEEHFQQCALDVGKQIPCSSKKHQYILIPIDYFTRWAQSVLLKQVNEQEVINFLKQNIITKFGVPPSFVFDNETCFSLLKLYDFSL